MVGLVTPETLSLFPAPTTAGRVRATGRTRRHDPDNSRQAAAMVSAKLDAAVLRVFRAHDRLTDDEAAGLLPELHWASIRSARSRLKNAGLVQCTTERRRSNRGALMTVWEITEPGIAFKLEGMVP